MTRFLKLVKMPLRLIQRKLWLVFFGTLLSASQYSYAGNNLEYKLKAAYLINLGDFIVWQDLNKEGQPAFSICITAGDPINRYLQEISQHLVKGKPLHIINILTLEQLKQCHIAYVGAAQLLHTPQLAQQLANSSVMTVSSVPGFVGQGGNIEFYIKDNKVRMRIDLSVSRKAGLIVSSKLLRLMEVVNP